jgi:uncharacterized membrane protein YfcA
MIEFILYPIVGVIAGFLAGLLGIGGGIVIVPCLLFVFPLVGIDKSLSLHMAIATSMAIVVITQLSALSTHRKKFTENSFVRLAKLFWPGILLGSVTGAWIANRLAAPSLSLFFGIIVFLLALKVIFLNGKKSVGTGSEYPWNLPSFAIVNVTTFIIGGLSALLGLGGGVFLVPFLQHFKVPMAKTIAISAFCGLPLAIIATVTYIVVGLQHATHLAWATGYIYWPAFLGVAITSMFSAPWGVKLAYRLPANVLRVIFVLFLLFVSIRMIFF